MIISSLNSSTPLRERKKDWKYQNPQPKYYQITSITQKLKASPQQ